MTLHLDIVNSLYSAVGASSVQFADMTAGKRYIFRSTTDCFVKQGANPTAAAAAANLAVKAGECVYIDPALGLKLAVIQASAGGHATLSPVLNIIR
jgi:hypothetical protein